MKTLVGLVSVVVLLAGCTSATLPEPAPEPEVVDEATPEPEVGEEGPEDTDYDPCEQGKLGSIWVLEEADGCIEPWPLTSAGGVLMCDPYGEALGVVVWNPDEDPLEYYAVNGMALGQGYPDIDPFWKDNSEDTGGPKVGIGALLNAGLSLCEQ